MVEKHHTSKLVMKRAATMSNGLVIPMVGFGCYQIKTPEPFYAALKHGYRHLDSAVVYGNEKMVGE
jgi:diketogulonate reductase-like aldo/keto reductase